MQKQQEEARPQMRRNLTLNDLDGLTGLMTEEEQLAARIMQENGNQVDLTA
jgi:flagellar hook-length control protein FliK